MSEIVCSKCGEKKELKDMFALPKKAGVEKTTVLCGNCCEDEKAEAKAQGKEAPVFYPLADSLNRDKEHTARKAEAEKVRDRVLARLDDEFLRRPNETIVCVETGRYHGEICWYKGGHFRVTVIEKAYPINFESPDIVVEPVSNDAIHQMIEDEQKFAKEEKRGTRFLKFFPLSTSYQLASAANNRKQEKKSRLDRAASNGGRQGRYNNNGRQNESEPASPDFTAGYMKGQKANNPGKTTVIEVAPALAEVPLLKTGTDDESFDGQALAADQAAALKPDRRKRGKK